MQKKPIIYESKIEELPSNKIYINVNNIKNGNYELNIIHKNILIKKTSFNKK